MKAILWVLALGLTQMIVVRAAVVTVLGADEPAAPCATELKPEEGQQGYRERAGRCEGLYVEKVSGTTLSLVGFTERVDNFDFATGRVCLLEWPPFDGGEVRIRAQGVKQNLHYRMDRSCKKDERSYSWPTDVSGGLKLTYEDIGVFAFAEAKVGDRSIDVQLPLRVHAPVAQPPAVAPVTVDAAEYEVSLLPRATLLEIYVTILPIDDKGAPGEAVRNEERLALGHYPSDVSVSFRISPKELKQRGLYLLRVAATVENNAPVTIETFFYRP